MARWRECLLLALVLCRPAPALAAEPSAQSSAAAEELYREGKRLLVEGRVALACHELETSQALDSAVGTSLLLGHCYEQLGKTASAWATFRSAESLAQIAGQSGRVEIARVRAEALESRLARLEIVLPEGVDASAWSIREDGHELSGGLLGAPIPVDPGERQISASAPGYAAWSSRVTVPSGPGVTRLRIPRLARLNEAAPRANDSARDEPLASRGGRPMPLDAAADAENDSLRTWSYVGLGSGASAIAVGVVYTVLASNRYQASLDACRTETLCSPRGVALRESAEDRARVASVATVSGLLLSTAGLVGWLLTPSRPASDAGSRGTPGEVYAHLPEGGFGIAARGAF